MSASSALNAKHGGLKTWQWGAVGVGALLLYVVVERRRAAASAAAAQTALSGGTSIPLAGVSASSGVAAPSTLAGWIQQALSTAPTNAGYSQSAALNDITGWLNGQCVSQAGYNWLGGLIGTLGSPVGYQIPPALTVCASSTPPPADTGSTPPPTTQTSTPAPAPAPSNAAPGAPPGLPAAIMHALAPGESVVSTQWDPTLGEWINLTNLGGIFNLTPQGSPGSTFYGSYLGLPPGLRATVPGQVRSFTQLVINPDGTYTAIDSAGESYTFTPTTPQAA